MNKTENKMLDSIQRRIEPKMTRQGMYKLFNLLIAELHDADYTYLYRNIIAIKRRLEQNLIH